MNVSNQLIKDILDFSKSSEKSKWFVQNNTIKIYMRNSRRSINNNSTATLEIANVDILPSKQNQGIFSNLLTEVEKIQKVIWIENVLSPRFGQFLQKRDYLEYKNYTEMQYPMNLYKFPNNIEKA